MDQQRGAAREHKLASVPALRPFYSAYPYLITILADLHAKELPILNRPKVMASIFATFAHHPMAFSHDRGLGLMDIHQMILGMGVLQTLGYTHQPTTTGVSQIVPIWPYVEEAYCDILRVSRARLDLERRLERVGPQTTHVRGLARALTHMVRAVTTTDR